MGLNLMYMYIQHIHIIITFPVFILLLPQLHDLLTKHCHKCSPEWLASVNKVLNKMGNNCEAVWPSSKVLGWCFGSPFASEVLLYYIDTI